MPGMDRREARTALRLAREWKDEGILPESSLTALEERYGAAAAKAETEPFGTTILYGLGGILLGSAVLALFVLLLENDIISDRSSDEVAPWMFLAWGAVCGGAAFAFDKVLRKPAVGDAFHAAALVAVTAAAFPKADDWPLWLLSMAYGLAITAYRRTRFMVPLLGLVAFNVAAAAFVWGYLERRQTEEIAFGSWFAIAALQMVALAAVGRLRRQSWSGTALGLSTLLMAGTFLGYYFDAIDEKVADFQGDAEIFLAALMGAAMAAGLALREKGMVVAAALVIAIDAIVFSFDVGEVIGGLVSILAVAGLLIWQAGNLRKYLKE